MSTKKNKSTKLNKGKEDLKPIIKDDDSDNLSDEFNMISGNKSSKVYKNNQDKKISNIIVKSDLELDSDSDSDSDSDLGPNHFNKKSNLTIKKELSTEENLEILYKELNAVLINNKLKSFNGEIISIKITPPHAYITIKILDYQIDCRFWQIAKSTNLSEYKKFEKGDKIKLDGYFSILKNSLTVYFNTKSMCKIGLGDYLALHALHRKKIIELGWDKNKKQLNKFPTTIGIITAIEGAAVQDILQAFKSDNFVGNIIIINAVVQGKNCPKSVCDKIDWVETNYPYIDVLMVTRGGGSYEDLVGFSDWDLVNRIHNCKLLTLSAVGHQIDNQLSDEVADYKFATPSLGAKFITGIQQNYIVELKNYKNLIKYYENKFNESKEHYNLINQNYKNIISAYNIKEIKEKLYIYSNFVKNKINKYQIVKNTYLNLISNIQPKIFKSGKEITSINDIINTSPKKLEIVFPDGKVTISYKIIES